MDRTNKDEVQKAVLKELEDAKIPDEKAVKIFANFMRNYVKQLEYDVFNQPRRSHNGNRSDICYWRQDPTCSMEDEMLPFMGFALKYFGGNWMTNWIGSFYDKDGDLLDQFSPIVN